MKKTGLENKDTRFSIVRYSLKAIRLSLIDAIRRVFDFSGRTSRAPYWIASIIFGLCAVFSFATSIWAMGWNLGDYKTTVKYVFRVICYFSLFILISLFVRRNHDLGDSLLDVLNPFSSQNNKLIGKTMFDEGQPSTNKFGPPHSLW